MSHQSHHRMKKEIILYEANHLQWQKETDINFYFNTQPESYKIKLIIVNVNVAA